MEPNTTCSNTLTLAALVASGLLCTPTNAKAAPIPAPIGTSTEQATPTTVDYAAEIAALVQRQQQQGASYQTTLKKLQDLIDATQQQQGTLSKQQQAIQSGLDALNILVSKAVLSPPSQDRNPPTDSASQAFFKRIAEEQRKRKTRPPLLESIEQLHCAKTSAEADQQLQRLFDISPPGRGWPDEWLGKNTPALHAGTVDIALATLKRTVERFPDLREKAERVALQWDYCPILENGQFFDLAVQDRQIQRTAASNAPLQWGGFRQWGFLTTPPAEDTRFIPRLLSEITLAPHAYQIFLHQVYRLHCFPHPVTGERYTETDANQGQVTHSVILPAPEEKSQDYPYPWQPLCELPRVGYRPEPAWPQAVTQKISQRLEHIERDLQSASSTLTQLHTEKATLEKTYQKTSRALEKKISTLTIREQVQKQEIAAAQAKQKLAAEEAERQKQAQAAAAAERERQAKAAEEAKRLQQQAKAAKAAKEAKQRLAAEAAARKKQRAKEQARLAALKKQEEEKARLAAAQKVKALKERLAREAAELERLKQLAEQKKPKKPNYAAMQAPPKGMVVIPTGPSSGMDLPFVYLDDTAQQGKGQATNKSKGLKLSGSVAWSTPVKGGGSALNANVTWTPADNMFITAATSYKDKQLTYAWSAGYSDWRPGTTSVQINNWGPLKKGDGLALDKATLNIGHKIDSDVLSQYKLSSSVGFSAPAKGKPSVNGTMQWNPGNNLYVRTTASQKLAGGSTNWSYGFGYADHSPGGWRVEYSNYGNNRHPFANLDKGTVTVSRGWKF